MTTGIAELEGRIAKLERQFRDFQEQTQEPNSEKRWLRTFGMFADYDDFTEVQRLGREYRERENRAELE